MNQLERMAEVHTEERLEALLLKLPAELRTSWRGITDDMELPEAIQSVEAILAKREIAKEKIFTRIHDIENPEIQNEVRTVIRSIETTFGDGHYFLGNGSVAHVYEMPYSSHVCVKYLVHPEMMREHGNNFSDECSFLSEMHRFEVEGIRVPDVFFEHMSDFGSCFGMEKIDGHSLNIIMEGRSGTEEIADIIRTQDVKDVVARMRGFVDRMHKEKKIVHRDFSPRNIMVDRSGNWYVIDFGRARRIEIGDSSTDFAEETDMASAENAVRECFKKLLTK